LKRKRKANNTAIATNVRSIRKTNHLEKCFSIRETAIYLIFGLPNETQDMMLNTVEQVLKLKIDSIKFHPLYVVKNTALASSFKKGKFQTISKELYIDTLIKALKIINNDIIVQRISAGIDDETLLAPMWCKNKQEFLRDARARLRLEAIEY